MYRKLGEVNGDVDVAKQQSGEEEGEGAKRAHANSNFANPAMRTASVSLKKLCKNTRIHSIKKGRKNNTREEAKFRKMRDDAKVGGSICTTEVEGEEQREGGGPKLLSRVNGEVGETTCEVGEDSLLCIDDVQKRSKRLIIEKLVLENFKSYSGVKVIGPFYKKFSCIVGPNGSGKSNIIDAMLFVFGRRAKKIRQNKLSDLIHSSKYSTNNEFTKVSIYFKTIVEGEPSVGEPSIGEPSIGEPFIGKPSMVEDTNRENVDPDDFVVSREATVDNQSKYRINEKVVSQKDVVDLLYKKGIDLNNNRFLILQGEVEQIAQMNPKGGKNEEGLLEYLEDIIGTNVYIESINENLEKLEKSEEIYHEKINRLKHVYNELKELAGPKKEAKYFMDLQKYTYKLYILLFKKDKYELEKVIHSKEKELKEILQLRDNHNNEYKNLLEERKDMNITLSHLEKEEEDIAKEKHKADCEFKKLTINDENIKKELLLIVEKMQNLYVKREELKEKKIPQYRNIIEEKQKIVNEIKKEKIPILEKDLEKCEEELGKYNEEIKKDTDKINIIYSNEEKKLAPLQNSYDTLIQSTSECTNKCNIIEKKKKEYLNHIENLKFMHGKIINELKEKDVQSMYLLSLEEEKKKIIKDREKDLNLLNEKIEKLNDTLTKEMIIYENVKKEVVTDKTMSKLHEYIYNLKKSKIKGIHGMLGDLGYIDKKYEKAFLIAGNNCTDFVVVETPNDATILFEEVRKENMGRVNVLSLSILEKNLSQSMKKNEENYMPPLPNVYRLIDFIKCKKEQYKVCFYYAVKETLVANTLEEAHVIGYTHKKRVVTVDGELIENDGRISGGGVHKQLKGVNNSIGSNRCGIKTSQYDELDLVKAEKAVREANKNAEELKKQKNILLIDIKELQSFLEDNDCKVEITKKRIENIRKQLKDIDDQIQNSEIPELSKEEEEELKSLKEEIEKKNNEICKIEIILKAQENKVKKYYEQLQNVGGEKKKKLKGKFLNAERQLNLMKEELEKHSSEEINALANLEKGEKDIVKFTEEIKEYENNEKDLEDELKNIESKGCIIYKQIDIFTKQLSKVQDEILTNQKKKQLIDETISKKDLENVDIVYKIEHIQKEINQLKAKEKHYEEKIEEYIELIQESEKIMHESASCHIGRGSTTSEDESEMEEYEDDQSTGDDEHTGEREETSDVVACPSNDEPLCIVDREGGNGNQKRRRRRNKRKRMRKRGTQSHTANDTSDASEASNKSNASKASNKSNTSKASNKSNTSKASNASAANSGNSGNSGEDEQLEELEHLLCDQQELHETENEYYDHMQIKDEELELLNRKEIEAKLESKLHALEKKKPNLKIFQDYNLKLYDYKKRRKDVKKYKKEKDKIKKVYNNLCNKRKDKFLHAFNIISSKLKEMYQMIAIGGDAELEIIDSSEIFNEGILFSVRPPKKSWKHIQNLSGGEKTLSSLALVFALHYFKPNPIYFMDEIDAALDFKNVSIISHYIKTKTKDAQFIVISLRNQMFELCDRMIGIYKTNDITKCITLNPGKLQREEPPA
ncbi:chromosome condensation protein, putative [Plasmodium ovale curtisi]|uniref:Structural maintenance of chromosomes protein n=1 Tax=Plasmodium ovale curtisi TaxID=864141 RepID=A0A1A8VVT1_PLAOA|nr:chromosome condensation protein, putative [Plasmodium ovale curtisi]